MNGFLKNPLAQKIQSIIRSINYNDKKLGGAPMALRLVIAVAGPRIELGTSGL